jgi:DNA primase
MLKSKKLIFFIDDVPSTWIFEHYLNLSEKLDGQTVKMNSIFQRERTPSMCVYYNDEDRQYKFKDFSSGKSGNGAALVSAIFNIPYGHAVTRIIDDYTNYLDDKELDPISIGNEVIVSKPRYKVTSSATRQWNTADANFWVQFGINSNLLNEHNIRPIQRYTMARMFDNGTEEVITIERHGIYGYYNQTGDLCKIYQPNQKSKKFIKIKDYIQGSDQLTGSKCLIICSSLKDALSLKAMKFKGIDVIAPDSENSMIPKEYMYDMMTKYRKIFTLFDDDVAGIKAMKKYEELYGISYLHLQMSKDLSDSVKDYGISNVKVVLYHMLKKAIG